MLRRCYRLNLGLATKTLYVNYVIAAAKTMFFIDFDFVLKCIYFNNRNSNI